MYTYMYVKTHSWIFYRHKGGYQMTNTQYAQAKIYALRINFIGKNLSQETCLHFYRTPNVFLIIKIKRRRSFEQVVVVNMNQKKTAKKNAVSSKCKEVDMWENVNKQKSSMIIDRKVWKESKWISDTVYLWSNFFEDYFLVQLVA